MAIENEERQFLHDISTPISTAILLVETLTEMQVTGFPIKSDELSRIVGEIEKALKSIHGLIKARRSIIASKKS